MYLGDSFARRDRPRRGRKAGIVVNVGPHAPDMPGKFVNLGGGFSGRSRCSPRRPAPCERSGTSPRLPPAAGRRRHRLDLRTPGLPRPWPGPGPRRRKRLRARRPHPGQRAVGPGLRGAADPGARRHVRSRSPPGYRRLHFLLDRSPKNPRPSRTLGTRRTRRPDLPADQPRLATGDMSPAARRP